MKNQVECIFEELESQISDIKTLLSKEMKTINSLISEMQMMIK